MQKMKQKMKQICNWEYFPFVVLSLAFLIYFFIINFNFADDEFFINYTEGKGISEYLQDRYETWTSRVILEFFMYIILKSGKIFERIFMAGLIGLLGWAISRVFIIDRTDKNKLRKLNWIIVFGIFLMNEELLAGAGFVATCMNYLFPVALGICSLIFVRKLFLNEKIHKYEYPIYFILTLIASNMELVCAVLGVVYILAFCYYIIKNKKINVFLIILILAVIANVIVFMICPGNDVRNESETATWYSEYSSFSILNKIELGLYSVVTCCCNDINLLFLIFTILIAIDVCKNYKNLVIRLISIIPVIMASFYSVLAPITSYVFPKLYTALSVIFTGYSPITSSIIVFTPYIVGFGCLFISIGLIGKKSMKTIILWLTIAAGLLSRFIMGFSPTVFASGKRTGFILICLLIIGIIILIQDKNEKYLDRLSCVMAILAILYASENICTLHNLLKSFE